MSHVTTGTESDVAIQLRDKGHGSSRPMLIHGNPLDGTSLQRQQRELLANGARVITHARHGVGRSTRPSVRCNYVDRRFADQAARTPVGPASRGRGIGRPNDRTFGGRRGGPRGAGAGARLRRPRSEAPRGRSDCGLRHPIDVATPGGRQVCSCGRRDDHDVAALDGVWPRQWPC